MKHKPFIFPLIAFSFLLIIFAFYAQIPLVYDRPWGQFSNNIELFSPINWITITFLAINAFLVYNVFGLLKYSLPLLIGVVAYNNFLVSLHSDQFNLFQTSGATILFAFALVASLHYAKAWGLIKRPGLRWWATSPRFERNLPVVVHSRSVKNMKAKTYDLSLTGAFLCSLDDSWNVKVGEEIIVTIEPLGFECHAKIVRITFGRGHYPEGVGIHFEKLNDHTKNLLKYFISGRPENLLTGMRELKRGK